MPYSRLALAVFFVPSIVFAAYVCEDVTLTALLVVGLGTAWQQADSRQRKRA